MIEIIEGNLLDSKEKYIAHQTNCISDGGAGGVARAIFEKYPWSDIYINRQLPDILGTIKIRSVGNPEEPIVINMNSQYYPGSSNHNYSNDTAEIRQKAFYKCLKHIANIQDLESIAFPFMIGCGLAGGNWDYYFGVLKNFEEYVKSTQNTKVVLYHLK